MGKKARILIAEDNKLWIENCRAALADHPVEVIGAMDVTEAIEKIQNTCFAAVFIDLEIPGAKGDKYGGFDILKTLPDMNPYTQAIVITQHEEDSILSQVARHNVSLCIIKPLNFREIQFAMDLIIERWIGHREKLLNVLNQFSSYQSILQDRKHNRTDFKIANEYDVQDILHVILKPFYPDLVSEEHTTKRAGSEKRIDFVIKGLETVVEIKMARGKAHAKKVADELDIDIRNYPSHPNCNELICFVYDPKGVVSDARSIEKDLSGPVTQKNKTINVTVLIRPA